MIVLRVMFQVCGHEGHGANPQPGAGGGGGGSGGGEHEESPGWQSLTRFLNGCRGARRAVLLLYTSHPGDLAPGRTVRNVAGVRAARLPCAVPRASNCGSLAGVPTARARRGRLLLRAPSGRSHWQQKPERGSGR